MTKNSRELEEVERSDRSDLMDCWLGIGFYDEKYIL